MKVVLSELSDLITIRNFLAGSIDNLNVNLTREELKSVQSRVVALDKIIIKSATTVDLSNFVENHTIREAESTEDTKTVLEKHSKPSK